jgi:hypothetical protein
VANSPLIATDPLGLEVVIFGRNPMMVRPGHGWRPMPNQRFSPRPAPRTTPGRDPAPRARRLPTERELGEPTDAPGQAGPRWMPKPPKWLRRWLRQPDDFPELPDPGELGLPVPVGSPGGPACGRKCPPPPKCLARGECILS